MHARLNIPLFVRISVAFLATLVTSCDRNSGTQAPSQAVPGIWKEFNGAKALEQVRKQVDFGPRPSGSETIKLAQAHIAETLKSFGWEVERQEFEATPVPSEGPLPFVNIIARFPSSAKRDTQRAIIASHYDTKRMDVKFVGANDGASSTGALLELARVLSTAPKIAEQVELVFFDGEEAVVHFDEDMLTGTDGLIGSRHYARYLRDSRRAAQFRFAIVWDMIGDANLRLTLPSDSPRAIAGGLLTASETLGTREHIGYFGSPILDDHVPLAVIARIPALDMIDFDYPPWHTADDTLDKLSAESLQIVGQMTLWYLARELSK